MVLHSRLRRQVGQLGINIDVSRPAILDDPDPSVPADETSDYFDLLIETLYTDVGLDEPEINVILLMPQDYDEEGGGPDQHLSSFYRQFDGDYRILEGYEEIQTAGTSEAAAAAAEDPES